MNTAQCCPVCNGRGFVHSGFYDEYSQTWTVTYVGNDNCRSCSGTGVVWSPAHEPMVTHNLPFDNS